MRFEGVRNRNPGGNAEYLRDRLNAERQLLLRDWRC